MCRCAPNTCPLHKADTMNRVGMNADEKFGQSDLSFTATVIF